MTQNSGPGGNDTRCANQGRELFEPELVHAGLAALVTLAMADQKRPAPLIDVGLV
jgi:hypothetical protein